MTHNMQLALFTYYYRICLFTWFTIKQTLSLLLKIPPETDLVVFFVTYIFYFKVLLNINLNTFKLNI